MPRTNLRIEISLGEQRLRLIEGEQLLCEYPVSTAKNGGGQQSGSECTPLGKHKIRAKIGKDAEEGAVFIGRRPTGEVYRPELAERFPERDWILSRILWLSGLERGFNRFGKVDTFWRYIYLHGCPDELVNGIAASHGCVRMRNSDIIELFEHVNVGVEVLINPEFTEREKS
jgi:lipoprotein-anchoring transpeptidase ErfK/SrfK